MPVPTPTPHTPPNPLTRPDAIPTLAEFRDGMACLAGAVTVITTDGPAGRAGFTASAVCSVTDSPPTLLVCMNRGSYAHPLFVANGVLCVNVLSGGQQAVSARFADRDLPMAQRFAATPWQPCASGAPGLDGALVQFDGRIVATHEVGTHSVFIVALGQVRQPWACGLGHGPARGEAVEAVAPGALSAPSGLAYFARRYHALGASPGAPAVGA